MTSFVTGTERTDSCEMTVRLWYQCTESLCNRHQVAAKLTTETAVPMCTSSMSVMMNYSAQCSIQINEGVGGSLETVHTAPWKNHWSIGTLPQGGPFKSMLSLFRVYNDGWFTFTGTEPQEEFIALCRSQSDSELLRSEFNYSSKSLWLSSLPLPRSQNGNHWRCNW